MVTLARSRTLAAFAPLLTAVCVAFALWLAIGALTLLAGRPFVDVGIALSLTVAACGTALVYGVASLIFRDSRFSTLLRSFATGAGCTAIVVLLASQRGVSYGILGATALALLFTGIIWLLIRQGRA